jgi:hypothetical protein
MKIGKQVHTKQLFISKAVAIAKMGGANLGKGQIPSMVVGMALFQICMLLTSLPIA